MKIVPFDMSRYESAYSLWAQTPGIGLSSSDSREEIALYMERRSQRPFSAAMTAAGGISITSASLRRSVIRESQQP